MHLARQAYDYMCSRVHIDVGPPKVVFALLQMSLLQVVLVCKTAIPGGGG